MPQAAEQLAGPSIETLEAMLDVTYTWGYQETRAKLRDLYDKAVRAQWISDEVLPWHRDVDLELPMGPEQLLPLFGSDVYNRLGEKERKQLNIETFSWTLSQFMHGEQGALLATAQLVDSVQDLDSKLYAASQVVDEARHVDVYNRYVHSKIGFSYPVNPHLKTLLDMILKDSRWDMKFLGMQIMVEGLALAAFGMIRNNTQEPLLKALTAYVMGDEARHVDVFNRYVNSKVGIYYPCNPHLKSLLDMILTDSRWDMKFLGMQIMVEGLALAAFAMIRNNTVEPLLRDLTAYVMGDEARHVAFGVLSLRDYYREQPESVRREREDFVYEAARLMRDRFLFQEVWEKQGLPVKECMDIALHNQGQVMFRQMLFAKIVPAIKKMDLLSDRQRQRFAELGILQFESWADPFSEMEQSPKGATSARF
ncbi:MAG TPA: ferritin-like domain-containing protein [Kofleriaceae bacterium]|nr:ferritin-like domain-containing protein [Kofleriaceae bacterium]